MISYKQNNYNRVNAVNYAKEYALSPNPNFKYFDVYETLGGDCTNFVSQCLLAGGIPMTYSTEHAWWYNNNSWSVPWAVAHSLYWTLKVNNESNNYGPKGSEISELSLLKLGDLIFYEDNRGRIYHSAIVTSFDDTLPLISQHTFNALNISYLKTWRAKRMHFISITN